MPGSNHTPAVASDDRPFAPEGERPTRGRIVEGCRMVRMADVGPDRRARLDALARYLHDVAEDDAASATLPESIGWVLRRTRVELGTFPTLGEDLTLATFCSATASRWAERTTLVTGTKGAQLRATSIWVALDMATGAPARLGEWFTQIYAPSASGRRASAKLTLGPPPPRLLGTARPWPLRRSDFDAWAHVNNAIAWAAIEDAVEIDGASTLTALVEHQTPITAGTAPLLVSERDGRRCSAWLIDAAASGHVLMAAALELGHAGPAEPQSPGHTEAYAVPRSS